MATDVARHCAGMLPFYCTAPTSCVVLLRLLQHYKRLPVGQVVAGQTAALALKKVKRAQVCMAQHSASRSARAGQLAKASPTAVCLLMSYPVV
jgi:hypothetical protein